MGIIYEYEKNYYDFNYGVCYDDAVYCLSAGTA